MVIATAAIRATHCYSVSPLSSSSSDHSEMSRRRVEGSIIEIPPLLHGGRVFSFFFFFTGSARAGCFPRNGCQYLGGFSSMSLDEDDELLSEGGPARAWAARASMPFGQVPSGTSETYIA